MKMTVSDLKSLIREVLQENKKKVTLTEAGLPRVVNIVRGAVPSVRSIGILTAQNPNGEAATSKFNNEANNSLESDLRSMRLGFMKIGGKFGSEEDSYLVNNISKQDLINLGKKYKQVSVIYGAPKDQQYFQFEYIESDSGVAGDTKQVILTTDDIQNREDFYSKIKNRKFVIPFFDDLLNNIEPKQGGRTLGPKS